MSSQRILPSQPVELDTRPPSKSQRKRDAADQQKLGEELIYVPAEVLAGFPLHSELREALVAAKRIHANGAKRRHMQHIGALMREADCDTIRSMLQRWRDNARHDATALVRVSALRDAVVAGETGALEAVIAVAPSVDQDRLQRLARHVQQDRALGRPPRDARLLFRLIRDALSAEQRHAATGVVALDQGPHSDNDASDH